VQRVGQPLQSANLDNPAISRVQLLHLMSPILRSARTEVNPIILLHSKKGMPPVNYKLAIDGWPESERIVIRNGTTSPSVIASFPLDFVRRGGDNTWQYILDMVENVVDPEPGQHHHCYLNWRGMHRSRPARAALLYFCRLLSAPHRCAAAWSSCGAVHTATA
jgi:hypothetical protein